MALLLYWTCLNLRLSTEIITRYENVCFIWFQLIWIILGPFSMPWPMDKAELVHKLIFEKKKQERKKEREELIESSGFSTIRLIIDFCVSE
jgi:hypothetical protein